MTMKKIKNQGFSLIQTIIVLGVISVLWSVTIELLNQLQKSQTELLTKSTILTLRNSILTNISNKFAWDKSVSLQPSLKCANNSTQYCNGTAFTKEIVVYDSQGNIIVNSISPTEGFTSSGARCNKFDKTSGSDECPIRAIVKWRADCSDALCSSQKDIISIEFEYKPVSLSKVFPFNPANYNQIEIPKSNMAGSESPVLICANASKIFIGYGKTYNSYTSDAQGCVPYDAFSGPRGDQGVSGPQGFQGPQGPAAACP